MVMGKKEMHLKVVDYDFAICKLNSIRDIRLSQEFCFIAKTDEEISYICSVDAIPDDCVSYKSGWKAIGVKEHLAFDLVGVVASIAAILAEHEIGVYSISTYNTVYMLIRKENLDEAKRVLELNGYSFQ